MARKPYKLVLIVGIVILSIYIHCCFAAESDHRNIKDKLKRLGISSDSISKITEHDKNVFESMDSREFEKLTPDLIADVGKEAIENLNKDQIKIMTKNLYQGNEGHLKKIFGVLNKEQVNGILDSINEMNQNSSERKHLNCVQFEPLMGALKRVIGDASKWNKDVFNKLGSDFVQCLPPDVIKTVAGNRDVYRTVLRNVKNERKHKRISRVEKKSLLNGATKAFGAIKDWKLEDVKSASSLVTMLKPKDLRRLDTGMVKAAIDDLGSQTWREKRGKELVTKLKDPTNGFGAISLWSAKTVERLGNLRGSLSKKELSQLSNETLRNSVKAFAKTMLPPYKKRALGRRLKKIYGKLKSWDSGRIRNASDLLGGMEITELEEMDDDALVEALPSVKDIKLPRHKGRVLAKKIQKKIGDVRHWNVSMVKKIGPLVKDLPDAMLKELKPDEAREAVKMLRKRRDVPLSKRRLLIKQALKHGGNTSRLSAKEFGAFVSEFPLTELKKIKSVDDLLPVESATNDSVEAGESMWNPSQARTLVEDLITNETNWGPVSESNENWDIRNIKKLGRLGLGLRKSDLKNLNSDSFPDFAAEFSQISNWTIGQAKLIGDGFVKSFKDRESEITATEVTSLGDFMVVVADPLLKELETETAKEAVRLMGASRLYQRLPKGLKQGKTKRALEILDKDVPSLTGEDLEDLGSLVGGLKKEEIKEISSSAFVDAVATLGDIEDLDKESAEALADKAITAYGGASKFDGEILHNLGRIVEGLRSADVVNIPDSVVEENLHIFAEATLELDVAAAVIEKSESSKRKRRAVIDMSAKTGDELIEMGSTLLALTNDQILDIPNSAFISTVAEISKIKGFTSEQLQAWANKTKSAWGSVSTFAEDQLLQLSEFAKGFTGDELNQMSFSSNEIIESFGSIDGYSQDQILKLWANIKTGKSISNITGDDLESMGVIVLGMTSSEIDQIMAVAYQDAALELGELQGWSSDQLKSLKDKAVGTFGAVSSWNSAEMSLAGAAIGGFTAVEIQSIKSDQLDAVKPSALQQIPADVFKAFSVEQIFELSPEQAAAATTAQRGALSPEQKATLLTVETDTGKYSSSGCCIITKWSYHALGSTIIIQFLGLLL